MSTSEEEAPKRSRLPSRRDALIAGGATLVGAAAAGGAVSIAGVERQAATGGPRTGDDAAAAEADQGLSGKSSRAGITWPNVPQRHTWVAAVELEGGAETDGGDDRARAEAVAAAGERIATLVPELPPDAGQATVLCGLAFAHAVAIFGSRVPGDGMLPAFAGDAAELSSGGDLVVQVCAETSAGVADLAALARAELGEHRVIWAQHGYRDSPTPHGTARTGIGFVDGIINPRDPESLDAGVWIPGSEGDTCAVYRRMLISTDFASLDERAQERAIGRSKRDGAPLSGGDAMAEVDLFAKRPDGELLISRTAHVRRAHPANIGRALMLRRSYSFDDADGSGLVFSAFLADPETFIATQRRLDEADELIAHTTTTASGCFFVPAAWTRRER